MPVTALLLVTLALDVRAQDDSNTSLAGSVRLNYASSSRQLDDARRQFAIGSEIKLLHTLPRDQEIEIEARFSYEERVGEDDYRAQLINAHWSADWKATRWRIGQQKVRWGKADGINPTDFFTPIDYTRNWPLEADQYQSIAAVRTDIFIGGNDTLSLVVSPDFTPTRLPWPSESPVVIDEDRPSGSRPQMGARWSHTATRHDWSVSAFRGHSTLPALSFRGLATDGGAFYDRYYPESMGFGADFARNFDQWSFRAEIAYTDYDAAPDKQSVASNLFLVSGVDRSFDNWNVNVQGILRYTGDYRETLHATDAGEQFAADMNGIVYHQRERWMTGMTLRVAAHWLHQTLHTELLAVALFDGTNYLVRPLVTYNVSDERSLVLGGEYYDGPDDTYFGLLKRNRTVFMEFRQYF